MKSLYSFITESFINESVTYNFHLGKVFCKGSAAAYLQLEKALNKTNKEFTNKAYAAIDDLQDSDEDNIAYWIRGVDIEDIENYINTLQNNISKRYVKFLDDCVEAEDAVEI